MAVNNAFFNERTACPVCSNSQTEVIYTNPLTSAPIRDFIASHYSTQGNLNWAMLQGTHYELCECGTCGLIYQRNAPNDRLLNHIYTEAIAPAPLALLEEGRLTLDNFGRIAGELSVLFRMTGKHPSSIRFLDYGFGHGRWARVARGMGAKVYATEIGEDKKQAAAPIGVEIIADEAVDRLRFDIVHTEQVFEHLVEPAREFRRLSRVTERIFKIAVPEHGDVRKLLKAEGMAGASPFTEVMLKGGKLSKADLTYTAILPLEHLNTYSLRTIEWLARESRMKLVSQTGALS